MPRLLLLTLCSLLLAAPLATPAAAKTVTLTYSIFFPASHGHTLLAQAWAQEIERRTGGAVKVNFFPGATLTPADQSYDGVVKGISALAMGVLSYVKGRFPLSEVIDLPLGYQSGLQATRLANAYFKQFTPKEMADTKIMYLHAHGPGVLHTKKPVERLDELAGLKIRCTGNSAKVVAALGATPVAMPQTETYDALQKGVVDGFVSPIETLKGWKFAEVIKSTTRNLGSSYTLAFFVAMNKKKWDSLDPEVKKTIEEVNREWIDRTGQAWDDFDQAGTAFSLEKGNRMITLSPQEDAAWAARVRPLLDEYVANAKAKGLPGDEALKFCQQWLAKNR